MNDTINVHDGSWKNLWSVKTILRSFDLVSWLKVNFLKSKVIGVNIEENFPNVASNFLLYQAETIPFKLYGISVGANFRRCSMWIPILDSSERKLSNCKRKNISIAWHITLINFVLNSLPLYFFSSYNTNKSIIKTIAQIQRNFLGGKGRRGKER